MIILGVMMAILLFLTPNLYKKDNTEASSSCPPHDWEVKDQEDENGEKLCSYMQCRKCGAIVSG